MLLRGSAPKTGGAIVSMTQSFGKIAARGRAQTRPGKAPTRTTCG